MDPSYCTQTGDQLMALAESRPQRGDLTLGEPRIFGRKLQGLVQWIKNCDGIGHDVRFTKWLLSELCASSGVMSRTYDTIFSSPFPATTSTLFFLRKEEWLDDSVLEIVLDYFRRLYSAGHGSQYGAQRGRNIFVPLTTILWWNKHGFDSDYLVEGMDSERVEKVFFIVPLKNHWGALCVDFKRRQIFYGDSLDKMFPCHIRETIVEWLLFLKVDLAQWDSCIRKFDVPQQPSGSGSCGVIACNAIERAINPYAPQWSGSTAACHRLRILRLITGYMDVREAPVDFDCNR
jgi:hypothetical protein